MSLIDKNSLNRLSTTEFFSYENEVWYKTADGTSGKLSETDVDMVSALYSLIEEFYPKAFDALNVEYERCKLNLHYFRFRVVSRFIKCNYAIIDDCPDLTNGVFTNFEYVSCPLRGECRYEKIICRPEFNNKLSNAEYRVMKLWYEGADENAIATELFLSPHTIHNHIRNAYCKLGIHSRSEFVRYSDKTNLFR